MNKKKDSRVLGFKDSSVLNPSVRELSRMHDFQVHNNGALIMIPDFFIF